MSETTKITLPNQFTVRLADEELDFINENIEAIIGEDYNISRNKIFVKAFTKAIMNTETLKPKTVEIDNPALIEKIVELEQQNVLLTKKNEELVGKIVDEEEKTPKNAIVLNLDEYKRKYLWGILQLCKKENLANSYEDVFNIMLDVFHKRNEFKFTQEDVEYLKTLEYED
ncbi:MAG: hypothetical protein K0B10_07230 [Vicingaceae bacterium]|nr:hypothetical protein [Vicingaceae bacterium]